MGQTCLLASVGQVDSIWIWHGDRELRLRGKGLSDLLIDNIKQKHLIFSYLDIALRGIIAINKSDPCFI